MGLTMEHSKPTHACGITGIYIQKWSLAFPHHTAIIIQSLNIGTIWGQSLLFCFRLFIFDVIIGLS
jgi:hypothetical protein